ncbi:hypothetical protein ILP97_37195 [Amycolatopsis sp. H6(2020)]|nr:hypothetical protein [Amycolatopsis sp. H6(2020)]
MPAQLVEDDRIVLQLGGVFGAVSMPAVLGHKVVASLQIRRMSAPALAHPGGQRWTLLSGPSTVTLEDLATLVPLGVSVVSDAAVVVLPSPETEALGLWHWIEQPSRADLAPQAALLATTRAMAVPAPRARPERP